jgi:pimeloyl-ACP methyl ester carboxylesterase
LRTDACRPNWFPPWLHRRRARWRAASGRWAIGSAPALCSAISVGWTLGLLLCGAEAFSQGLGSPELAQDERLAKYAQPQQLIRLRDGRRIHLYCLGQGSPTVIMTAGLGDWTASWGKVHDSIAAQTRACAWDRPGFGFSDPSPAPQDVSHTNADLEQALENAHIEGPYVLLGHSMGSYESLRFADRHPGQVLGMVLVDPSFPDQFRHFDRTVPNLAAFVRKAFLDQGIQNLKKCASGLQDGTLTMASPDPDNCFDYPPSYPPELKQALSQMDNSAARFMTQASALEQFRQSSRIVVNRRRSYGAIPVRVLTASEHEDLPASAPADAIAEGPIFAREWRRAHDAMAALSTNGVSILVEGASHDIQEFKPEAVVFAVGSVVDEIRTGRRGASEQR